MPSFITDPRTMAASAAAVAVVSVLLSITVTPPMHHTMYQTMGKNNLQLCDSPGLHLLPLPRPLSRAIHVKTALDVDKVSMIKVGAQDGTELTFEQIEIGNKPKAPSDIISLVDRYGEDWERTVLYDQVHYIMSTVCARMTSHEIAIEKFDTLDDLLREELQKIQRDWETSVEILSVRVYKPTLPRVLAEAYAAQAEQKAHYKVEIERNVKIKQENLNKMEKASGDYERAKAEHANQIQMNKAAHDNEMTMQREIAEMEANASKMRAEANQLLHTSEFLELKKYEAMLTNTKQIITGDAASALFAKIIGSD